MCDSKLCDPKDVRIHNIKRIECSKKIASFAELKENWNSYGASPISHNAITKAIDWLTDDANDAPDAVVPTSDGGIQFERHSQGVDREMKFSPDKNFEWLDEHSHEYPGQWVAIRNGVLLGHCLDRLVLRKQLQKENKLEGTLFHKMPHLALSD